MAITSKLAIPATAIIPRTESIQRIINTDAISPKGEGKLVISHTTIAKISRSQRVTKCPLNLNNVTGKTLVIPYPKSQKTKSKIKISISMP